MYLEMEQQRSVRRYDELRNERNISRFQQELDDFRQEHDLAYRKYENFLVKLRLPEVYDMHAKLIFIEKTNTN